MSEGIMAFKQAFNAILDQLSDQRLISLLDYAEYLRRKQAEENAINAGGSPAALDDIKRKISASVRLEDYFNFLAPNDIRIKGHRIGIESILYEYIHNAKTPEEIGERFPTITLEQVYATILYYQHNKEFVGKYLAEWIEHGRRMREEQERNPTPAMLRLRKIKAELEAAKRKAADPQTS